MTYHLELPGKIEQDLTAHAAATGTDVLQLIRFAVVQFVERDVRKQKRQRLLPDPPHGSQESSPPPDLPLCGERLPVSVTIRHEPRLQPDSLPVDA